MYKQSGIRIPDFSSVAGNVCVHTGKLIHIGLHAELRPSACGDNFESVPVKAAENIDCIIRYCQIIMKQRIVQIKNNSFQFAGLLSVSEMFGSGFKKVYAICKQSGTRTDFRSGFGGFSFIFFREQVSENVTDRVIEYVTDRMYGDTVGKKAVKKITSQEAILELLKENPLYSREEMALAIGKTIRTVQRALDSLVEEGKIRRIGTNRAGYWEILYEKTPQSVFQATDRAML